MMFKWLKKFIICKVYKTHSFEIGYDEYSCMCLECSICEHQEEYDTGVTDAIQTDVASAWDQSYALDEMIELNQVPDSSKGKKLMAMEK